MYITTLFINYDSLEPTLRANDKHTRTHTEIKMYNNNNQFLSTPIMATREKEENIDYPSLPEISYITVYISHSVQYSPIITTQNIL